MKMLVLRWLFETAQAFLLVYSYLALTSVKGYTKGWYGGQSLIYLGVASVGSISS